MFTAFYSSDDEPPQFQHCPVSMVLETDQGLPTATFNTSAVTVTDNAGTPSVTTDQPGNILTVGVTQIVIRATDTSGNNATCAFSVRVVGEKMFAFDAKSAVIVMPFFTFSSPSNKITPQYMLSTHNTMLLNLSSASLGKYASFVVSIIRMMM